MNSRPIHSILNDLREHQLLAAPQLAEVGRLPAARAADPKPLAKELIQRGWLTPYQVNQLVQGRGKELVVGPYRILDRLGEGPASKVFKARHPAAEKVYAIKLLPRALIASPDAADAFARFVNRLQSLTAPFLSHFCNAPVIGDNLVIVSEYLDGTDLARLVEKSGPLPVAKALDYVRQVAAALQFLHQVGLAHRNIKASNLLLCQPGNGAPESVKLLDLAQAPFASQGDIRGDLFALGGTFFFLLTGRMPLAISSITQLRPDVPPPVKAALDKLLAKRPEDRFQTPADLLAALASTASLPTDKTLLGNLIAPAPQSPRAVTRGSDDKTMLGNLIAQTPAPPKATTDKTMVGNLIAQAPAAAASEETLLGEFIGQAPGAGQQDGSTPVSLGTAKALPSTGGSGIVKKAVMVLSAIGGAGMAAAIILGVASWLGQYQLNRKVANGGDLAEKLTGSTRPPSEIDQPPPNFVPEIDPAIPLQPGPKSIPEPKAEPKPLPAPPPPLPFRKPKTEPEPKPNPEPEPKPEPNGEVAALIRQLKDKDEAIRLKAAKRLEKLGPEAKDAIPALTEALKDPDEDVRAVAQRTLDKLKSVTQKDQVASLVKQLKDKDEMIRFQAARKLGQLGAAAVEAIPALKEALRDEDANVRGIAKKSLDSIQVAARGSNPALADIFAQLKSNKQADRVKAASELAKLGEEGKDATATLIQSMIDTWPKNKEEFLDALEKVNPRLHKPVVTLMIDKDYLNVLAALDTIESLGPNGRDAMPVLLLAHRIGQQSSDNRYKAVGQKALLVMTTVDPQNQTVIQMVVGLIPTNDALAGYGRARQYISPIILALRMKIDPKVLVPALIQALNNDKARMTAIHALGSLGPAAKSAIPALRGLRFDPDNAIREAAAAAIKRIGEN